MKPHGWDRYNYCHLINSNITHDHEEVLSMYGTHLWVSGPFLQGNENPHFPSLLAQTETFDQFAWLNDS
jgi:hypothetical protein